MQENASSPMLEGKVIVVTGAGNGIGRDFALTLAAQGARVVVNDLGTSSSGEGEDAGPAQKVVDEIRAAGGTAVASTDSVAEWHAANRIIKTAIDAFGRIVAKQGLDFDLQFFNNAFIQIANQAQNCQLFFRMLL